MKYVKRPVVIEAVRIEKRMNILEPSWLAEAIQSNTVVLHGIGKFSECLPWVEISTLEGIMRGNDGDWIICGVNGEMYPCKDEIFRMTYEPAVAHES